MHCDCPTERRSQVDVCILIIISICASFAEWHNESAFNEVNSGRIRNVRSQPIIITANKSWSFVLIDLESIKLMSLRLTNNNHLIHYYIVKSHFSWMRPDEHCLNASKALQNTNKSLNFIQIACNLREHSNERTSEFEFILLEWNVSIFQTGVRSFVCLFVRSCAATASNGSISIRYSIPLNNANHSKATLWRCVHHPFTLSFEIYPYTTGCRAISMVCNIFLHNKICNQRWNTLLLIKSFECSYDIVLEKIEWE